MKKQRLAAEGRATSPAFALFVAAQHDPRVAFWTGAKPDRRVRSLRRVFTSDHYVFESECENRDFLNDLAAYLCGPAHGFTAEAESPRCVTRLMPEDVVAILEADLETQRASSRCRTPKPPRSPGRKPDPKRQALAEYARKRAAAGLKDSEIAEVFAQEFPESELITRNPDGSPKLKALTIKVKNARQQCKPAAAADVT